MITLTGRNGCSNLVSTSLIWGSRCAYLQRSFKYHQYSHKCSCLGPENPYLEPFSSHPAFVGSFHCFNCSKSDPSEGESQGVVNSVFTPITKAHLLRHLRLGQWGLETSKYGKDLMKIHEIHENTWKYMKIPENT